MEQLTLFSLMEQKSDFPCDDCVFEKCGGVCGHIEGEDFCCVRGSFRVRHSAIACPNCGRKMEVVQADFQSDWAKCRCGTVKIFNNRGNRPTALELYKAGRLVGR